MKKLLMLLLVMVLACGGDPDNLAPEVCPDSVIAPMMLFVGDVGTAVTCFADPEGDRLELTVMSSDEAVATAQVQGMLINVEGKGAGEARMTVRAADPDGEMVEQGFDVTITALPMVEVLLRDEFNELSSAWTLRDISDSGIEDGRLWITNEDKGSLAYLWQPVAARLPIVRTNLENSTDDMWATIRIDTTDDRYRAIAFIIGGDISRVIEDADESNLAVIFWDERGPSGPGWYLRGSGMTESYRGAGEAMTAEIEFTEDEFILRIDDKDIAAGDLDGIPTTITRVGVGATWPEDIEAYPEARVYFDWVEVMGFRQIGAG